MDLPVKATASHRQYGHRRPSMGGRDDRFAHSAAVEPLAGAGAGREVSDDG